MGVAIYIVTREKVEDLDTFVNGKALGRTSDKTLDKICALAGVPSLYDYVSQDPEELREFIEDEGMDVPDELPEEKWFQPSEGKRIVDELITYLKANPKSMKGLEAVVEDLEEYASVFEKLEAHDLHWHFAIDF